MGSATNVGEILPPTKVASSPQQQTNLGDLQPNLNPRWSTTLPMHTLFLVRLAVLGPVALSQTRVRVWRFSFEGGRSVRAHHPIHIYMRIFVLTGLMS